MAVYTVPLIDGLGNVVERHVMTVALPASAADTLSTAQDSVRALTTYRLGARRKRVAGLMRSVASERSRAGEKIGRYLYGLGYPEEAQPELFSQRAARDFDLGRRESQSLSNSIKARADELEAESHIQIGEPMLELLVSFR